MALSIGSRLTAAQIAAADKGRTVGETGAGTVPGRCYRSACRQATINLPPAGSQPAATLTPTRLPTRTVLDEETAVRLRIAILRISRRLRPTDAGRAAGLTPTRSSVLLTIVREGPIGLSALADGESLNPTMLSRVISDLVEAGCVARVRDPGDRRTASVRCTAAGRRLAERIRRERTAAINAALSDLDAADRDALELALAALEGLAEALQERHP